MEPVRFFKVLTTDIEPETSFELPSAFITTLNNVELNSMKALLKSSIGRWEVGVKKCNDGLLHLFGKRWEDFVSAHELEMKDFIVFEHIGHLHFNTLVFDETCCEKELTTSSVLCRFFKVLIPGFETSLKLPPTFVSILNNTELNSKSAVLKSCKGLWKVRVKKCDNGLLHFFGKSWEDYVSAHKLKAKDFIVFEPNGRFHFDTLVFDETCCEKDFAREDDVGHIDEENEEEENSENDVICLNSSEDDVEGLEHVEQHTAGASKQNVNSRFQMTVTSTNFFGYTNVPAVFARSNGIREDGTITLRNATGDLWLGKLKVSNESDGRGTLNSRVRIRRLLKFFKENRLKVGDKCIFELDPSSEIPKNVVMDVLFVRKQ